MQLANHSAKHFDRGNGWKSRSRVILLVIFAIIALAATVFGFVLPYYLNASSSLNSDASDGNAKVQQKSGKSFAGLSAPSSIPFDLDGIDANAPVVDVSEGGTAVPLDHSWKCGGNYQNIAAAPADIIMWRNSVRQAGIFRIRNGIISMLLIPGRMGKKCLYSVRK